ncbi:MFS transporter [Clostridium sp. LBM24168]
MNNIKLMYIMSFLQGLIFYGPAATLYRQSRGLSIYHMFLIESIFMILMIMFEVPWGWFADRYGYKRTLIISNFILFLSKIIFYFANSFSMFLCERILMALYSSGISGCDTALLYSCSGKKNSEKLFGVYNSMNNGAFILASFIFTFMSIVSLDFTVFASIFPCAIAFFIAFFIDDTNLSSHKKYSFKDTFRNISIDKRILIIVVSTSLISEVAHSIGVFLNQIQYIRSGLSIKYFGILTSLVQCFCILAVFTHTITKKFGVKNILQLLIAVLSTVCLILAYTNNPFLSVFLIAATQGIFAIISPIVLNIENESITADNRATILSTYAIITDIIASFVNIFLGVFADISIKLTFLNCSIIAAVSLILAYLFFHLYKTA